jgi:hypothetical protein
VEYFKDVGGDDCRILYIDDGFTVVRSV